MIPHTKLFDNFHSRTILSPNHKLLIFDLVILIFKYLEMYLGRGLAPYSPAVGSLLRTPWLAMLTGKMKHLGNVLFWLIHHLNLLISWQIWWLSTNYFVQVLYLANLTQMEQHTLKNVNNCLNTNIYSYLETSIGQSSNPHLNVVHFLNTRAD